jgi:spore germination protein GerM
VSLRSLLRFAGLLGPLLAIALVGTGCSSSERLGANLPEADVVSEETTVTGVFFATGRSIVEERRVVDAEDVYMSTMDEWLAATPVDNPGVAVVQPEAEILSITLEDGIVTIDWSAEVLDFEATESEQLVALASVLRMFGQFPEVEQVRFTVEGVEDGEVNGKDVRAFWGSATLIEQPWDVFRPQPPESQESTETTP